jgi:hypothetical protein
MVEYVLNVVVDGELDDVIEGAERIRDFIKDKKDSVDYDRMMETMNSYTEDIYDDE